MQPESVVMLNIDLLVPNPKQPRKIFNDSALSELAGSIKKYGILNPILAIKKDNQYQIIAGERRYRAAKMIGLHEVPVIIKELEESKIMEIALIENLQRENITPIEEAKAYEELLKETDITEQELSNVIGKSQPFISNKLRLLKLPEIIQEALNNRQISEKHARSLLTINNQKEQETLLTKIIQEKLTVKELEKIIQTKKEEKESDNMNNGNFFPNFNNNEPNTNNMSLNTMNMQTMNVASEPTPEHPMPQAPDASMPAAAPVEPVINVEPIAATPEIASAPVPQVEIQNMDPAPQPIAPIMPEINTEVSSPIPDFGVNAPSSESNPMPAPMPNTPTETQTPSVEIPLFNENIQPTESIAPVIEAPLPQGPSSFPAETPLFNNELNNQSTTPNLNESFYEVPVNVSPVIDEPQEDKFTKVSQLLSSNNIEYKAYSNETGHCIIIEL